MHFKWKRKVSSLLSIFLLSISVATAENPAPENDEENPYYLLCGQADEAITAGDYDAAAARLLEAMALRPGDPGNIMLMSNLGLVYAEMGNDSLAIATFDKALGMAPNMRTIHSNRARVLLRNGRTQEALQDFQAVINADSLNTEARYYHGLIALHVMHDTNTAEKDFAILASADPTGHSTAIALGALYTSTGRHAEALPYLRRLADTDPEPEHYAELADCLITLERLAEASEAITKGMEKFPNDAELYLCRARLNKARWEIDDAKSDAKRAISLGADPARAKDIFK